MVYNPSRTLKEKKPTGDEVEMTVYQMVGKRLTETGMSKRELFERMGLLAYSSLDKKLKLKSELSLSEAKTLAAFLGISLDELCAAIEEEYHERSRRA